MLDQFSQFKNVALVGSTSEIGYEIIKYLKPLGLDSLYIFGRDKKSLDKYEALGVSSIFFELDVETVGFQNQLIHHLSKISSLDLAIIALGFLPPENQELDANSVLKTMVVNAVGSTVVMSCFASLMKNEKSTQILYISTVASMRPRLKNFTYGASKKTGDYFAEGMHYRFKNTKLKINILRPGFVYTKMSEKFDPAPFAIEPDLVAKIAINGLLRNQKIIYAPTVLRILMNLVVRLPRFIFDKFN